MTRRQQLLAALAQGDASVDELVTRLSGQQWTHSIARAALTRCMKGAAVSVWVSKTGGCRAASPRRYTSNPKRAVKALAGRKAAPTAKECIRYTPGGTVNCAIRNRTLVELAWVGQAA